MTRHRGHDSIAVGKLDIVVILALVGRDKVVLERQYRPVLGKYIYEVPAGHIEKGERPMEAAIRELKEETGYGPSRIVPMLSMYACPGLLTEKAYVYIATGLRKGKSRPDPNEHLSVRVVGLKKALQMIETNEIEDAKTIVALLYYSAFIVR
jgi:ADP-ribose pyrophosphatase